MANRQQRAQIARETLEILERGHYTAPDGRTLSIEASLRAAIAGTRLFTPEALVHLLAGLDRPDRAHPTRFTVANETTFGAARRLIAADPGLDPLCLNFASARNPGGGFLGGSQAQEESLARASGLYSCISPVEAYYTANRRHRSTLYTHHMIYSPRVPIFRDDDDRLLAEPVLASIVTAPAVNAGAVRRNEPDRVGRIEVVMRERIARLLGIAREFGRGTLVLGAWGCGVFRNDPEKIALWFRESLVEDARFRDTFRHVHFAVLDHTSARDTLRAFEHQFDTGDSY